MTKQFMLSLVFVLALGIGLGGAFSGGVAFGKNQGEEPTLTQQPSLLQQRSESEFGRGGLTGVIDKVEDNIVTVITSQGPLSAALVADTTIGRFTEGTWADLQTGMRVTIVGHTGADSGVEARSILLNPEDALVFFGRGFFSGSRQQPGGISGGDAGSSDADRQEHSPGGGFFFGGGQQHGPIPGRSGGFSGQHQP